MYSELGNSTCLSHLFRAAIVTNLKSYSSYSELPSNIITMGLVALSETQSAKKTMREKIAYRRRSPPWTFHRKYIILVFDTRLNNIIFMLRDWTGYTTTGYPALMITFTKFIRISSRHTGYPEDKGVFKVLRY